MKNTVQQKEDEIKGLEREYAALRQLIKNPETEQDNETVLLKKVLKRRLDMINELETSKVKMPTLKSELKQVENQAANKTNTKLYNVLSKKHRSS